MMGISSALFQAVKADLGPNWRELLAKRGYANLVEEENGSATYEVRAVVSQATPSRSEEHSRAKGV